MAKKNNYIPWNEYRHVETRKTDEDWENYLFRLSKVVGDACERFFVSRGMTPGSVEVRTDAWKKRHEIVPYAGGAILDGKLCHKIGSTDQIRDESGKDASRSAVEICPMK